jgi:hypothetical protein
MRFPRRVLGIGRTFLPKSQLHTTFIPTSGIDRAQRVSIVAAMVDINDLFGWTLGAAKFIGSLAVIGLTLLYAKQESLLYMPNPPGFPVKPSDNPRGMRSPDEWHPTGRTLHGNEDPTDGIPYEEAYILTEDGVKLHTWLLMQPEPAKCPTLIYFHGNAGNMGFRLKNAAHMYAFSNLNVLMMDYRGYGASGGTPTERGLELDGKAVSALKSLCTNLSKCLLFRTELSRHIYIYA